MSLIQNYVEKHKDIMSDAAGIMRHLDSGIENADEVRKLLSLMAGKLKVHLAAEDRFLYPLLMKSDDIAVQKTAEKFVQEMGGIYTSFSKFLNKWPSGASISKNSDLFSREMKEVLSALAERIRREDEELYPLAAK